MDRPSPSAVTKMIAGVELKNPSEALPLEVIHNLQHQHNWTDLRIHRVANVHNLRAPGTYNGSGAVAPPSKLHGRVIISGIPPRQMYIHPDLLNQLVQHSIKEDTLSSQREWVLPTSVGEKWSLKRLCGIFDSLPTRTPIKIGDNWQHQDSKRIFLGMLAHNGAGGDGTIVYYIMQEGEVKPRQN